MFVYLIVIALVIGLSLTSARPRSAVAAGVAPYVGDRGPRRMGRASFGVLAAGAVLVAVAAFRWRVGVDYWQYELSYQDYTRLSWGDLDLLHEPGIRVIAKLCAAVNDDPATMFAVASILTVGLTVYTICRNAQSVPLALLLYILAGAWQGSFNGVRQYLACAIVFAGHKFIIERRLSPYVATVLVASLFHISALAMLLAYWIPRRRLRLAQAILLLVVAAIAVNSYAFIGQAVDAIKGTDAIASSEYFSEQVSPLRVMVAFAPSLLYLALTVKERLSPKENFYANMMFLYGVIMLSSAGSAYVARFGVYTGVFVPLAVPALINMEDRRVRTLITLIVVTCYAIFWYNDTASVAALSHYRSVFDR